MGSNANGAEGAEGKTEKANFSSKDPKDPSWGEAVLEALVSEEDAENGRNVGLLESTADGSRKATNAEMRSMLGDRASDVAEKSVSISRLVKHCGRGIVKRRARWSVTRSLARAQMLQLALFACINLRLVR
jgi:hypothetical protein